MSLERFGVRRMAGQLFEDGLGHSGPGSRGSLFVAAAPVLGSASGRRAAEVQRIEVVHRSGWRRNGASSAAGAAADAEQVAQIQPIAVASASAGLEQSAGRIQEPTIPKLLLATFVQKRHDDLALVRRRIDTKKERRTGRETRRKKRRPSGLAVTDRLSFVHRIGKGGLAAGCAAFLLWAVGNAVASTAPTS